MIALRENFTTTDHSTTYPPLIYVGGYPFYKVIIVVFRASV